MTDDEFLAAFLNCSLPAEQWNHRAHVRIAYLFAIRHDLATATECMRSGIKAFNRAMNTPEAIDRGYHETMTQAFMRMVFAASVRSGPYSTSDEFCDARRELMEKRALLRFYSRARIMTMLAKTAFVEPDLCPLPRTTGRLTIVNVMEGDDLESVRRLLSEYAKTLSRDLCLESYDADLADLPGSYALPRGRLLLACDGRTPAGCVAVRPVDDATCEMKRLWVAPSHRNRGLGRHLATSALEEARRIGCDVMRLDTTPSMTAAIALYRQLGFVEVDRGDDRPDECELSMQFDLRR